NWDLFVGNYHARNYIAELQDNQSQSYDMPDYSNVENVYPVDRFGIVLQEDVDLAGNGVVRVYYVHPDSPFNQMISKEVGTEVVDLDVGMIFQLNQHLLEALFRIDLPDTHSQRLNSQAYHNSATDCLEVQQYSCGHDNSQQTNPS
ncbi:MAG: hypothetical protein KMY54_09510, partial [Erysipelothrix sp.]|nr:hypothetical protein [Erysipelothrix sp.]